MIGYVGFVFTETFLTDLQSRGFSFACDETNLEAGYRSFRLVLADSAFVEIREVFDEEVYLRHHQVSHFEPTTIKSITREKTSENMNTVIGFRQVLTAGNAGPGELRTFLQIRKAFPLWAVWLTCLDFEQFCQSSHPDRIFDWNGEKLALIHLGPNCFDLIISAL